MDSKTRGIYRKYSVTRTDGQSWQGQKHDGCEYFVLDVTHDKFAEPALRAYAEACKVEYPRLAADITYMLDNAEARGFAWTSGETRAADPTPESLVKQ